MSGYKLFVLKDMIAELGEDKVTEILSSFLCPLNADVQGFLHSKAIEFEKRGYSTTYLVYTSYKNTPQLVGYFSLALKQLVVNGKSVKKKTRQNGVAGLSKTLLKRLSAFSIYDKDLGIHTIPAPLIGQLGKNYANSANKLITGDELLKIACDKVWEYQRLFSGRIVYLECEDNPKLVEFYSANGFVEFGKRPLELDEKDDFASEYLVQMLKDLKSTYT